jgi:hypothetical protein
MDSDDIGTLFVARWLIVMLNDLFTEACAFQLLYPRSQDVL